MTEPISDEELDSVRRFAQAVSTSEVIVDRREFAAVIARLDAAVDRLAAAQAVVDAQAEDEGLWFIATRASEAYLQQELRRLHAVVEGDALKESEG